MTSEKTIQCHALRELEFRCKLFNDMPHVSLKLVTKIFSDWLYSFIFIHCYSLHVLFHPTHLQRVSYTSCFYYVSWNFGVNYSMTCLTWVWNLWLKYSVTGYIPSFLFIAIHCMCYFILHIYREFPTRVAFRLVNSWNSNLEFRIARFHWELREQDFAELKTCELKLQW